MTLALVSCAAAVAAPQCMKLSIVGNEFTFLEMILNVLVGTGYSGSPQWLLCVGRSIVVCIPGKWGIVCWFVGGTWEGVGVSVGVCGVSGCCLMVFSVLGRVFAIVLCWGLCHAL